MDDWLDSDADDATVQGEISSVARRFNTLGFMQGVDIGEEGALQSGFNKGFRVGGKQGAELGVLQGSLMALLDLSALLNLSEAETRQLNELKARADALSLTSTLAPLPALTSGSGPEGSTCCSSRDEAHTHKGCDADDCCQRQTHDHDHSQGHDCDCSSATNGPPAHIDHDHQERENKQGDDDPPRIAHAHHSHSHEASAGEVGAANVAELHNNYQMLLSSVLSRLVESPVVAS